MIFKNKKKLEKTVQLEFDFMKEIRRKERRDNLILYGGLAGGSIGIAALIAEGMTYWMF